MTVELTNFVTYTSSRFDLGSRMNLVVGPNGSGKSSLVAAIGLGLNADVRRGSALLPPLPLPLPLPLLLPLASAAAAAAAALTDVTPADPPTCPPPPPAAEDDEARRGARLRAARGDHRDHRDHAGHRRGYGRQRDHAHDQNQPGAHPRPDQVEGRREDEERQGRERVGLRVRNPGAPDAAAAAVAAVASARC